MTSTFGFQDAYRHIDVLLANFAAVKSTAITLVIMPGITTCLSIGWIMYGVAHWQGKVEEPFMAFVEKTVKMGAILFFATNAAEYNDIVIQTFQDSPVALASALSGTPAADATLSGMGVVLDESIDHVNNIASAFFHKASFTDLYPIVLGALVVAVGFPVTIAAGFLIALSKVASALILSLGPLFICALLFEWSKNYFTSYINLLIQYGLVGVLAVGANALILDMFSQVAGTIDALHGMATLNEISALIITGGLGILTLWQVPSMAAALAGGVSLSTFGVGRKIAGGTANKLTNKQGRDNQKAAENSIDVAQRKERLQRNERGLWRQKSNEVKDGTNG